MTGSPPHERIAVRSADRAGVISSSMVELTKIGLSCIHDLNRASSMGSGAARRSMIRLSHCRSATGSSL